MKLSPKTYYIKTLGCQANEADSNTMAGILEALGFEQLNPDKKYKSEREELLDIFPRIDLFIVNSCSVRQKSEDKVYGLGKIISLLAAEKKRIPFIILSGCMVGSVTGERQRYKFEELQKKTPWVHIYINPQQIFELPHRLVELGILDAWAVQKIDLSSVRAKQREKTHAFVNISQGCDNFCTFCVVPYARGKEVSRTKEQILTEIKHLVRNGFTHITLCGQNVNSWGLSVATKFKLRTGSNQKIPFAELLREVHDIPEITKIDFISSNPFDFTNDLIDAIKLPKISNYIHIAVQSGNNDVLKNMGRRHTVEQFIDLEKKLRLAKPNLELGTDIIVGFPGEKHEQFMDTVELFKKVKFNVAFISIYSPRKGTIADRDFPDDVPLSEKKSRHDFLMKVWKETSKDIRSKSKSLLGN